MPLYRVYVKTINYGRVHVEAESAEAARQFVEEHPDEVEVDNEPEENSTFGINEDEDIVQVCSRCEGNPDDVLTDGKCGMCR